MIYMVKKDNSELMNVIEPLEWFLSKKELK